MILTDREIKIAIRDGAIEITPEPEPKAYASTSVDLTLDPKISEFKAKIGGIERIVDLSDADYDPDSILTELTQQVDIPPLGYIFHPNSLILAWTREYVDLKIGARIAARVEGKSSLARLGVGVHITAPTIHAGFKGQIRLEMINHGKVPIRLRAGMKICQLILEQTVGTPETGYKGRYSGQTNVRRG